MNGKSNNNGGIRILAEFTGPAIPLPGSPAEQSAESVARRSANEGVFPLEMFDDRVQRRDNDQTSSDESTALRERVKRAEHIVAALVKGVAALGVDFLVSWANPPFREWCSGDPIGKTFVDALGDVTLVWPDVFPAEAVLSGSCASLRLQHHGGHYLDVNVTPIVEDG